MYNYNKYRQEPKDTLWGCAAAMFGILFIISINLLLLAAVIVVVVTVLRYLGVNI